MKTLFLSALLLISTLSFAPHAKAELCSGTQTLKLSNSYLGIWYYGDERVQNIGFDVRDMLGNLAGGKLSCVHNRGIQRDNDYNRIVVNIENTTFSLPKSSDSSGESHIEISRRDLDANELFNTCDHLLHSIHSQINSDGPETREASLSIKVKLNILNNECVATLLK